jgi:metal-responsive CopG/Arc/MetJ family transcriptional regulator
MPMLKKHPDDIAKPLTISVPDTLTRQVDEHRGALGMTRSEYVRAALRAYLENRR